MDLDNLMEFAVRTAEQAGRVTLSHFGTAAVEFKGDGSEITEADRAAEAFLHTAIAEAFPDDGIFGEEGTRVGGRSGRRWVVDPIDGTRSFASGVPLYGVMLALEERGEAVLGCCHFPALGQTVVAARGAGAWFNGRRALVSACDDLRDARVVTSGLEYWRMWATEEGRSGWDTLVAASRVVRTWGDCYGYCLVATGRAEVHVDPAVGAYWDHLPLGPIVMEAGGRFSRIGGSPVRAWTSALATNGRLHAAVAACWDAATRGDAAVQVPAMLERQAAEAAGGGTPLASP